MKKEEEIVHKYLLHQNYQKVVFEPDGRNVPPDFSIEGKIGVEVRRLNQHFFTADKAVALEDLEFELIPRVKTLLKTYQKVNFNKSAFVFLSFERPLKASKQLLKEIRKTLDAHLQNIDQEKEFLVRDNLKVRLVPASSKYESAYLMGGSGDGNSGGFVAGNIYQNLEVALQEKQKKVQPHLGKYESWWLVLVDRIGFGIIDEELDQLNELAPESRVFEKVILVSPLEFRIGKTIKCRPPVF